MVDSVKVPNTGIKGEDTNSWDVDYGLYTQGAHTFDASMRQRARVLSRGLTFTMHRLAWQQSILAPVTSVCGVATLANYSKLQLQLQSDYREEGIYLEAQ
jgi:hypothetical protein